MGKPPEHVGLQEHLRGFHNALYFIRLILRLLCQLPYEKLFWRDNVPGTPNRHMVW